VYKLRIGVHRADSFDIPILKALLYVPYFQQYTRLAGIGPANASYELAFKLTGRTMEVFAKGDELNA